MTAVSLFSASCKAAFRGARRCRWTEVQLPLLKKGASSYAKASEGRPSELLR